MLSFCLPSQAEKSISKRLHCPSFSFVSCFCSMLQYIHGVRWHSISIVLTLRHYVLQTYMDQTGSVIKMPVSRKIVLWQRVTWVFLNVHNLFWCMFFFKQAPLDSTHIELTIHSKNSVPFHRAGHIYDCTCSVPSSMLLLSIWSCVACAYYPYGRVSQMFCSEKAAWKPLATAAKITDWAHENQTIREESNRLLKSRTKAAR